MFSAINTHERIGSRTVVWRLEGRSGTYIRLTGRQSLYDKRMRVKARFSDAFGERVGWFVSLDGDLPDEPPQPQQGNLLESP
jgi:hypothetical protein